MAAGAGATAGTDAVGTEAGGRRAGAAAGAHGPVRPGAARWGTGGTRSRWRYRTAVASADRGDVGRPSARRVSRPW
ncbi:hypothetical protein SSCG_02817 [Streptomyces clavuligerus]|nr:hypothetical protein SSCG_02817 [Streptomyces clavuligerus]